MTLRPLLFCCCLLLAFAAHAEVGERWYSVRLDQRHVGYMVSTREVQDERLITRSELRIQLQRNGERLLVESEETSIETADGRPLGFSSRFETVGTSSKVEGTVGLDGEVRADVQRAGGSETVHLRWPSRALLAEGQRLALLAFLATDKPELEFLAFDPTSMRAMSVRSTRSKANQQLVSTPPLDGEHGPTIEIKQTMGRDGSSVENHLLLDLSSAEPLAMRVPALGLQLEFIACDRACAMAEPEAADVLARAMVESPRPLRADERLRGLQYQIRVEGGSGLALGTVPGQHLSGQPNEPLLLIDPQGGRASPPQEADLRATRWLQSDDPVLRDLALDITRDQSRDSIRMTLLERRVRDLIQTKSLRIGYASAREALDLAEGDCTEHAVLLAALARAVNIPARVVTGLAYSTRFGSRRHVFVPHAWVIAWVDGRWQGYDAALPRFDAAHIGLASGHGDPFDFYSGLDLLGRLQISSVERASRRELRAVRALP